MTENTGVLEVGEGVLWRTRVQSTTMKTYTLRTPFPARLRINRACRLWVAVAACGYLVAIRLKVDRGEIQEIEHLWANGIDAAALPLEEKSKTNLSSQNASRSLVLHDRGAALHERSYLPTHTVAWAARTSAIEMPELLLNRGGPIELSDDPPFAPSFCMGSARGHQAMIALFDRRRISS